MDVLQRWKSRRESRRQEELLDVFITIYGPCLSCGRDLKGHELYQLASTRPHDPNSQDDAVRQFLECGDLKAALGIREFVGAEDALLYELVRCPDSGTISLLEIRSVFELWVDDRVVGRRILSPQLAREAFRIVGSGWRTLEQLVDEARRLTNA